MRDPAPVAACALTHRKPLGKSSLVIQFIENNFVESYYPTIESTFSKTINYNGTNFDCDIIDTAGQVSCRVHVWALHYVPLHCTLCCIQLHSFRGVSVQIFLAASRLSTHYSFRYPEFAFERSAVYCPRSISSSANRLSSKRTRHLVLHVPLCRITPFFRVRDGIVRATPPSPRRSI